MRKRPIAWMLCTAMLLTGCTAAPTEETTDTTETTIPWQTELIGTWEAEQGTCIGGTVVEQGYVTGFEKDEDACSVSIQIDESGFYDLDFTTKAIGGSKINYVALDGERVGEISSDPAKFGHSTVRRIYIEAGAHTVTVSKFWGYINWDKLEIYTSEPFDESVFDIPATLVNPNATDNAKRLMSYLCDMYGEKIISGQYCDTGMNGWEMRKIAENNGGKYPAVLGLDMGYYSQTGIDHEIECKTTEQAIACWEGGGIVTICWHWLVPEKYVSGTWYSSFRPEHTNINLKKILNGQDDEGLQLIMQDIDNIAQELLKMQEAGVPVLWRPLHEASGGWFWWGAEGADVYKQLYILLYDTLTNTYGLNNLIWLWNGQDATWYPGDEYVDIVGIDIYAGEHTYSSQSEAFLQNLAYGGNKKLVVLSENGTMIDPDLSVRDRAMWGFFCTWSGEFVMTTGVKKAYSEQYTDIEMLTKVYNSEYVITRDELPDLKTYPIREDSAQ